MVQLDHKRNENAVASVENGKLNFLVINKSVTAEIEKVEI